MYDLMLESGGTAMLMLPFFSYVEGNRDASYPTFRLTHWARDRRRGPRFPLEYVVRKQTLDTANLFGLTDRGVLGVGKKADLNVIDVDGLRLEVPRMAYDLPARATGRLLRGVR